MKPAAGVRVGRWTLLEQVEGVKPAVWKCVCDCGQKRDVRQASLNSGRSRSCGCLTQETHRRASGFTFKGVK